MRQNRFVSFLLMGAVILFVVWMFGSFFGSKSSNVFNRTSSGSSNSAQSSQSNKNLVPWDYKIEEKTVGDLVNGDMTVLPDNQLLPNDDNYATGDKIWTLSYMNAEMTTDSGGKTSVALSPWSMIKSYKSQSAADQDLSRLKDQITTEVDLVGVYKTKNAGKFREFAVITLPSGNDVKQPISEERYANFKSKQKVKITLEEIHNFENYDDTMGKFRGWNE